MEVEAAPLPGTNPKPGNPYSLLEETRTAMEEIAARLLAAKKEGRPKSELRELITQMSLLFISLRQVNRAILMEEDRVKTETERAKAPVDFTTLQLHNLLYEKNHYSNAIKACRDFTSKYPDIELVPEEEFFAKAPENIKGKALTTDPAHDLMLKRLNFELYQRKELCKMHERLEHQKKVLLEKISERKMFLSSLPSQLKSLKKASLPVQQQLGILHSKRVKQHHMADFLPKPLYIAYSQLMAQKEAFDERIEVEIVGSMKDVQAFMQEQANREHGQMANAEDNKLEEDVMEEDDDMQRRRARPKKELSKEATSDKEGINSLHPLKIMLSVLDHNEGEKPVKLIVLRFEYLVKLNVVCVGVEGADSDKNIPCNLFPDDTGSDLPHQAAKLSAGDSLTFEHMGSHPYKWAQHLAGIDFLPELPPSRDVTDHESLKNGDLSADLTMYRRQNRVQTILLKIRSRKQAQMALLNQLNSLSKLEWPSLNYDKAPWAGYTPSCRIDSWTPMGSSNESSSFLAAPNGEVSGDLDRRSVTQWDDVESNREDGELPVVVNAAGGANWNDKEKTPTPPPDGAETDRTDFARSLSLLSKSAPSSKKDSSVNLARNLEDEIMVDGESEAEEFADVDIETPEVNVNMEKPWQGHALSEFKLILRKRYSKDEIVKLEAKVKIGMEYPLRPSIFNLSIFPEAFHGSKWQNELRAMKAEVNLHIIGIIPVAYENYVLANQIRCLGMLFDLNFGASDERRKIASVVDMRIGEPTRSIRGRDRRMAIYWKHSC